ncbi:TLC domain-containing protein 1 isoform X2 [Dermochelys coriacea]|uniref:TLC domain-containing protein 1 isoform X2 n=1 Tax=Dermochelys coriacea TaxID=27794 RepID=UPI001CA7F072|nr:TLC domain-containing protein 1 isoform X2 [Dermochelys coriacea]
MGPWLRAAGLVLGSTLLFKALQWGLRRLPLPAHVRRDPTRAWRWRNLLVSFVHSVVTGLWAVLCVWQVPEMLVDIENTSSTSGYLLLCFSAGYFIHDTLDIIVSHQSRASWEYLVHHAMAISAFFSGISLDRFVAAGMLSLFVETYLTWYFVRYVEVRGQGAFLIVNLFLLDAMILTYFSRLLHSDFFPDSCRRRAGKDAGGEKFLVD